jgi:hypothetical protein
MHDLDDLHGEEKTVELMSEIGAAVDPRGQIRPQTIGGLELVEGLVGRRHVGEHRQGGFNVHGQQARGRAVS